MNIQSYKREKRPFFQNAFTLVEILIVVIILALIAAIVIPQVSSASVEAKENMLRENLRALRIQIACYMVQHRDAPPGYPQGDTTQVPTADMFIAQMTRYTDEYGNVSDAWTSQFCYGPYLREIPGNPISQTDDILLIGVDEDLPVGNQSAWLYQPTRPGFWTGYDGIDSQGRRYYDY